MELNRPQTTKQSSRKGKRSWRKNIDLDDIHKGLEESREAQIVLGKDFDNDFVIDNEGDSGIKKKTPKKLKSREILENKSKVKPLELERNRGKIQGVSKKEVHRLMKLSGRVVGESKLKSRVEKQGLYTASNEDIWGSEEGNNNMPDILKQKSSIGYTKAKHAPETMKVKPLALKEIGREIDAGKSYNPSLESWKQLISKEFNIEKEKEIKRQELLDHQEKIRAMIASHSDEEEENEEESDQEIPAQIEENKDKQDHVDAYKLSVNAPTKLKIKTKAKRNREARHKERLVLQERIKELKQQLQELAKVEEYRKATEEKSQNTSTKKEKTKKKRKLFKFEPIARPLEVKLSDELTNNLKNVKPEGNLFYDSMINLQEAGKIETRIPVAKKRKYTPKITEKWTYKDFK